MSKENEELLAGLRRDQERRGVLESSIDARHRRVRALMRWAEPTPVLALTRHDINTYLDQLGISNASRRGYISHFHAFFVWAAAEGHCGTVPTTGVARPKQRRYLPRPMPDADLRKALAWAPPRVRWFLLLAAYAGLRAKEIAALRQEDIDRGANVIYVRGKGDKDRVVPLHPKIAAAIPNRSGCLAPLSNGAVPRPHNVCGDVNRFLHSLDIRSTLHSCRHAFATNVYRQTRDLLLVQRLLGHSSPSTTAIYAQLVPDGEKVVENIDYGTSEDLGDLGGEAA